MLRDSNEYNTVTSRFIGEWEVLEYVVSGKNYFGDTYGKITKVFDFDSRQATITFCVSRSKIDEKLKDWKEQYPDLVIDEYKVVVSAYWKLSNSGEIIYLENPDPNLHITGSGSNFDGFYGWERTRFEASKAAGDAVTDGGGGLLGMVASRVTKAATGTSDLFPKLMSQGNFDFSEDGNEVRIYTLGNNDIRLRRIK